MRAEPPLSLQTATQPYSNEASTEWFLFLINHLSNRTYYMDLPCYMLLAFADGDRPACQLYSHDP